MNYSRKYHYVMILISIYVLTPVLIAKSSEDETKLKFGIENKKSLAWTTDHAGHDSGVGPIKPTHVAVVHIRRPHGDMPSSHEGILEILNTSAGQTLSQQQRMFLTASDAIAWLGIVGIKNHDTVRIYAVSEEDAKKTVQAYLEVPTKKANERMREYEKYLKERKQEIIEIKKILPERQKQADQIEPKYMEIKNKRYFSLSHTEAYGKAKETMLEMDKMLDVLNIELAGIREKMLVINEYRKTPQDMQAIERRRKLPEGMLVKLDQMFVEQTIELKSAEAREQAAIKIRDRDKAFVDLHIQWKNVSAEVHSLETDLKDSERNVKEIGERLADPDWRLLPPEIYQNRVTIYPVLSE